MSTNEVWFCFQLYENTFINTIDIHSLTDCAIQERYAISQNEHPQNHLEINQ